ncbi:MAG: BON domain-containing protein [Acidobacteriaceae bacterium]|nr:BON domain-containing protein [Acidobacteriaceae bacterium]
MRRVLALFVLSLFSLLLVLPSSAKVSGGGTPTNTAAHASAPRTDAQIDATIRAKLAKSKIGKDGFHFHVQHGVVTWEGSTNVIQHKGSATRMARTAGATQVINNIQISANAKAKATANLKKASVVE